MFSPPAFGQGDWSVSLAEDSEGLGAGVTTLMVHYGAMNKRVDLGRIQNGGTVG